MIIYFEKFNIFEWIYYIIVRICSFSFYFKLFCIHKIYTLILFFIHICNQSEKIGCIFYCKTVAVNSSSDMNPLSSIHRRIV